MTTFESTDKLLKTVRSDVLSLVAKARSELAAYYEDTSKVPTIFNKLIRTVSIIRDRDELPFHFMVGVTPNPGLFLDNVSDVFTEEVDEIIEYLHDPVDWDLAKHNSGKMSILISERIDSRIETARVLVETLYETGLLAYFSDEVQRWYNEG